MNIKKIISRLTLSKAAYEEQEAIQYWKQDAAENASSLRRILEINELQDRLNDYQQVNTSAAWTKVENRMERRNPVLTIKILRNIAAVMTIIVMSVVGYTMFMKNSVSDTDVRTYVSNAKKDVILHDGSKIILDKTSTLRETGYRRVQLDGRAYFDITKDISNPFSIQLMHGKITVLGTSFNINTSTNFTQIYVTEGKVKYEYNTKEYILIAGDMLDVTDENVIQSTSPEITPEKWISSRIVFENKSLHDVMKTLAVIHKTDIIFDGGSVTDQCKINTSFSNENLDQILEELKILANVKYSKINNKILIK